MFQFIKNYIKKKQPSLEEIGRTIASRSKELKYIGIQKENQNIVMSYQFSKVDNSMTFYVKPDFRSYEVFDLEEHGILNIRVYIPIDINDIDAYVLKEISDEFGTYDYEETDHLPISMLCTFFMSNCGTEMVNFLYQVWNFAETFYKEKEERDAMKNSFLFFNCDEWNSTKSMNPVYNNILYRNRAGRRAMWKKVKDDTANNVIKIAETDMPEVRKAILEGNPEDANNYMKYGHIVRLEEAE